MIRYPKYKRKAHYRQVVDKFKGYNRNLRIGSGEFSKMENLTSDDYPVLSVRKKRGRYLYSMQDGGTATGMLFVPGTGLFITVDHLDPQNQDQPTVVGSLLLLGTDGATDCVTSGLAAGPKSLALMGKYLIIAPDMKWVHTDDLTYGEIHTSKELTEGAIKLDLYMADGTPLHQGYQGATPPEDPQSYSHWVDTSAGSAVVRRYSVPQQEWVEVSGTLVKLESDDLAGNAFSVGDTVNITGLQDQVADFNGWHEIKERPSPEILVVNGIIPAGVIQSCQDHPVKLERSVPSLDFIVECGNRIWGCCSSTNELFACKLGDFKNWNSYPGISTDSWNVTAGTPGPFTGAAVQNGYPIFYKEHCKHKVWPSATAAHQMTTVSCAGVEKGSEGSLAVCDGTVFYKSTLGIFADDGGGPVEIGQALGKGSYRNGIGAVHDRKYYLSLEDTAGKRALFVFDISAGMWHRESSIPGSLCSAGESLFGAYGELWDLTGNTGTPEEEVSWMAVTGDLGLENPEQKYISRLTLRLSLDPGATLEIYAQYDREQTWVKLGQVYGTDLRSFSLPVRPRRCDQLKLKLQGRGMCKVYSITKTLEKGSELP